MPVGALEGFDELALFTALKSVGTRWAPDCLHRLVVEAQTGQSPHTETATGQLTTQRRMFSDTGLGAENRTVNCNLRSTVLGPIKCSAGVVKHLTPRSVVERVLRRYETPQKRSMPAQRPRWRIRICRERLGIADNSQFFPSHFFFTCVILLIFRKLKSRRRSDLAVYPKKILRPLTNSRACTDKQIGKC